jgi:hypothetical protein
MLGSSDSLPAAKGKGRTLPCARRKARAVLDRPPLQGWRTTDEDEVALRRWRGRTGISAVEPIELEQPIFGAFRVHSVSGSVYEVEIRSFESFTNSCSCLDHRANGLGTCKHIEGVLAVLRQGGGRTFRVAAGRGSPRVKVFPAAVTPRLRWRGPRSEAGPRVRRAASSLPSSVRMALALATRRRSKALISAWRVAPASVRPGVRVSRHFAPWLDRHRRGRGARRLPRQVRESSASFDLLRPAMVGTIGIPVGPMEEINKLKPAHKGGVQLRLE